MQKLSAGLILAVVLALDWAGVRTLQADAALQSAQQQLLAGSGNGIAALETAIRERPDEAEPLQALALQVALGHPHQALALARQAVQLDPVSWSNWRTVAMIEYQLGEEQRAWKAFEAGIQYNRGFQAHFEAANLALVLGKEQVFWEQLRQATAAAASPYHNQLPFALAAGVRQVARHPMQGRAHSLAVTGIAPRQRAPEGAQSVPELPPNHGDAERLASIVPQADHRRTAEAVEYLLSQGKVQAATLAWGQVAQCAAYAASDCGQAAAAIADGLLGEGLQATKTSAEAAGQAVRIWDQAVQQHWLRQGSVSLGGNADPNFADKWLGHGFSWHDPGVVLHQEVGTGLQASPTQVIFRLDGMEPESAVLVYQVVAVKPDSSYRVVCRAERQGSGKQTGVQLVVSRSVVLDRQELLRAPVTLASAWTDTQASFQTGLDTSAVILELVYQRPYGGMLMRTPMAVSRLAVLPMLTAATSGPPRP